MTDAEHLSTIVRMHKLYEFVSGLIEVHVRWINVDSTEERELS